MKKNAFSLIELLVTLAVIGIISVASLQVLNDNIQKKAANNSSNNVVNQYNTNDPTTILAGAGRWEVFCSNNKEKFPKAAECKTTSAEFDPYSLYYVVFNLHSKYDKTHLGMIATYSFEQVNNCGTVDYPSGYCTDKECTKNSCYGKGEVLPYELRGTALGFADAYDDPLIVSHSAKNNITESHYLHNVKGEGISLIPHPFHWLNYNNGFSLVEGNTTHRITYTNTPKTSINDADKDAFYNAIDTIFVYNLLKDAKDTGNQAQDKQLCGSESKPCSSYTEDFRLDESYKAKISYTLGDTNMTMVLTPRVIQSGNELFLNSEYKGYSIDIKKKSGTGLSVSISKNGDNSQDDSSQITGTVDSLWTKDF